MECFEIKWTGPFHVEEVLNQPEARRKGVYYFYKKVSSINKPQYIGKAQNFGERINTHNQGLSRFEDDKDKKKIFVHIGTIFSFEKDLPDNDITPEQLKVVESFLINSLQPQGNGEATKKGFKHTPVIIANTGKLPPNKAGTAKIDKVMSHSPQFLTLLKSNLAKKTASSTKSDSWF
jgi:hypothetical protein